SQINNIISPQHRLSQDGGAQDDRKSLDFCLDTLAYLAIGLRFDGCGDGNAVGAPVR
ncbi:hypothetical protein Bpfe_019008, partial [Biomphalaria pfeifferi]